MVGKLLRRAWPREGHSPESLNALQDLVFANENVIQCLTGARFCGQVIPRHKRFSPTKFVYRGAQCLLQFPEERALGRAVEIAAHQVRDLALFRRLDAGDQLLDLRLADGGRTALLKMPRRSLEER